MVRMRRTRRGLLALPLVMKATALLASGPSAYETPFVDEIGLLDVLEGRFPDRLRNRDVSAFVVYLQLTGQFEAAHAELFARYQQAIRRQPQGEPTWTLARAFADVLAEAPDASGTPVPSYFPTSKYLSRVVATDDDGGGRALRTSQFVHNCQDDAFRTARATFADRSARYGAASVELVRWIEAQIKVFAQCDGETAFDPPVEPAPDWLPLEQHDRRYQIAAAYFYSGRYLEAATRFEAIARTPASPWCDLGRYLVPRSLAREAIINGNDRDRHLDQALRGYRELSADPDYLAEFPSVAGQIRFLEAKRDPVGYRRELVRRIVERPASVAAQEVEDLIYLHRRRSEWTLDDDSTDYERWWLAIKAYGNAAAVLERWRREPLLPWLYLSLEKAHAGSDAAALSELILAADGWPRDTPGYFNVLLQRIRLRGLSGDVDAGLQLAEEALRGGLGELGKSEVNRLRSAAADIASNWRDYFRWASQKPLSLPWTDDFARSLPPNLIRITRDTPLFSTDTMELVNAYFTPSMILEVIDLPGLGAYQRGRLAIAGWIRAMLGDDLAAALELSSHIRRNIPALDAEFERFEQSDDKHFEAARIVFDHPAFSPWLEDGAGRVQQYRGQRADGGIREPRPIPDHVADGWIALNWWCAWYPDAIERRRDRVAVGLAHTRFSHYSEGEREAIGGVVDLGATAATTAFGPHVIRYAKDNLDDPRVPRTLHRVVFATRHACHAVPGEISRGAYALLHEHFPDSEWTAKTPYWFGRLR